MPLVRLLLVSSAFFFFYFFFCFYWLNAIRCLVDFVESIQQSSVAHRSRHKHGLTWKVNFSFETTDGLDSPIISFRLWYLQHLQIKSQKHEACCTQNLRSRTPLSNWFFQPFWVTTAVILSLNQVLRCTYFEHRLCNVDSIQLLSDLQMVPLTSSIYFGQRRPVLSCLTSWVRAVLNPLWSWAPLRNVEQLPRPPRFGK